MSDVTYSGKSLPTSYVMAAFPICKSVTGVLVTAVYWKGYLSRMKMISSPTHAPTSLSPS